MKIAFTSCFDALAAPTQPVWQTIADLHPEVLLLLGDNIYMDYGRTLNEPTGWNLRSFSDEMYRRYAAQWQVPGWLPLLRSVRRVGVIWDDHDFAWNNSHAAGKHDKGFVADDKYRISRALFQQFRDTLQTLPDTYPAQPDLNHMLDTLATSIQDYFDWNDTRIILLDGRSFRTAHDDVEPTQLGLAQREQLKQWVSTAPGLSIVCTGSPLKSSFFSLGRQGWKNYGDYRWLVQQELRKIVFLSGDIHNCMFDEHHLKNGYVVMEATASGAARPDPHGGTGNFGMLDCDGTKATVQLYTSGKLYKEMPWLP